MSQFDPESPFLKPDEPLPKEFADHPAVERIVYDAVEEMWRSRVSAMTLPGRLL